MNLNIVESFIEKIKSTIKYFPEIRGYDNIEEKGSSYYNNANIVPLKDGNFIYFDQQNICRIYNINFEVILHLIEIKEGNNFLFSTYCENVIYPLLNGNLFCGGFFSSILEISNDYKNYKVVQKINEKNVLDCIELKNNFLVIILFPNKITFYKKNIDNNLYEKDNEILKKIIERKDNKIRKLFLNFDKNSFGIIYDKFIDIYNILENSIEFINQIKLFEEKLKFGKYFLPFNKNILIINCYKDEVEEFEKNLDEIEVPGNFEEFFNFNKNQFKGLVIINLNTYEVISIVEINNIIHGLVKYDDNFIIILEENKLDKYNSIIKVNVWELNEEKVLKFIKTIEEKEKNLDEFQSFENAISKLNNGTIIYTLAYNKQ